MMDARFYSVVRPRGRRASWAPGLFVEAWEDFVDQVVDAYWGDIYEYENELSVRSALELALSDRELNDLEAWRPLAERIVAADDRIRPLLDRGPRVRPGESWWRERLPPYAGEEFVADAARLFGVTVEVIR